MGEEGQGAVAFHSTPAGPPARNCNKSTIGKAKQTFFSKRRGRGKGKGHLNEYARRVCHPTPLPWLAILVKYLCFSSAFLCVSPGEGGEEEEEQKRCKKHRQRSVTTFFCLAPSPSREKKEKGATDKKSDCRRENRGNSKQKAKIVIHTVQNSACRIVHCFKEERDGYVYRGRLLMNSVPAYRTFRTFAFSCPPPVGKEEKEEAASASDDDEEEGAAKNRNLAKRTTEEEEEEERGKGGWGGEGIFSLLLRFAAKSQKAAPPPSSPTASSILLLLSPPPAPRQMQKCRQD